MGTLQALQKKYPGVHFISGVRFVENGKVATAGGLTSGIDLALHVVERYYGREVAEVTADYLEYRGDLWKNPAYGTVKPVTVERGLAIEKMLTRPNRRGVAFSLSGSRVGRGLKNVYR